MEHLSWSPDGRRLLVLAADIGADRAGIQAATKIQEEGAKEEDPKVKRPFEAWRRLFTIDVETGATEEVGPEGVHVFEVDWDGERAVAICADEPTESAWYGAYVALLDLDARTAERVYEPEWQIQCPVLAGDSVWFVEGFCSDRGVLAGDVKVVELGRRDVRDIPVENTDVSFLARARRRSPLVRRACAEWGACAARSRRPARWTSCGPATPLSAPASSRTSRSGGDRLLSIFESPDRAPEVVEFDDGDWRALSDLNGAIPDPNGAGTWEARTWSAADGLEIEGLLLVPHEGDAPYPLIVCVHGGPTGAWSWGFLPAGSPGPLLAQEGYAVLLPNPRGSAGRGQEFARANLGDIQSQARVE